MSPMQHLEIRYRSNSVVFENNIMRIGTVIVQTCCAGLEDLVRHEAAAADQHVDVRHWKPLTLRGMDVAASTCNISCTVCSSLDR